MTNSIPPLQPTPAPITGQNTPSPAPKPPVTPRASAPPSSDSVTLSAAAQTTTNLLGAARAADGVNLAAIDQIRGALASGNYNVSPEDLAQAIATVLKETN